MKVNKIITIVITAVTMMLLVQSNAIAASLVTKMAAKARQNPHQKQMNFSVALLVKNYNELKGEAIICGISRNGKGLGAAKLPIKKMVNKNKARYAHGAFVTVKVVALPGRFFQSGDSWRCGFIKAQKMPYADRRQSVMLTQGVLRF